MDGKRFAKGTERLVDPVTVGSIHFLQQFFGLLPLGVQRALLERSSKASSHMGFVVEPYAFFLAYRVADEQRASALLPKGFKLAKSRLFEGDEEACYAILSFFRVHTSAFWGLRCEWYLIAEDERTGLLSWIIVDYLSDTVSYDQTHGLRGPSAPKAVVTTSSDGRVLVDVEDEEGRGAATFDAALSGSRFRPLDRRLWVEGNLSIGYGRSLSAEGPELFSLTFLPEEMDQALDVPLAGLQVERMTWHDDLLAPAPERLACFPFAQHLLSDSPGRSSAYPSEDALVQAAEAVDFSGLRAFSTGSVRTAVAASVILSAAVTAALAIALIVRG